MWTCSIATPSPLLIMFMPAAVMTADADCGLFQTGRCILEQPETTSVSSYIDLIRHGARPLA